MLRKLRDVNIQQKLELESVQMTKKIEVVNIAVNTDEISPENCSKENVLSNLCVVDKINSGNIIDDLVQRDRIDLETNKDEKLKVISRLKLHTESIFLTI